MDAHAQRLLVPVPLPPPGSAQGSSITVPPDASEPERWTKEDLTLDEQYSTAKKEAQAAHQLAKEECLLLSKSEQPVCLLQAKNQMEKEMAAINKRFGLPE